MAGARPILGLAAIIILAGGVVLQFLVILSGAIHGSPINKVYFLQANTGGIAGGSSHIPNPARWTYFAICGVAKNLNANCGKVRAALPFDPPKNFHTTNGVPSQFIGTTKYYYLSRVMFALYLVALFFAVIALLMSVFALCSRLAAKMTGLTTLLACFFQVVTAALMTAWTLEAKKAFKKNGQNAKVGVYAYGFTWAAFACFLISTVLFCVGGGIGKNESTRSSSKKSGYFGRKRSTRSRGSFVDSENGRTSRIKDDYD